MPVHSPLGSQMNSQKSQGDAGESGSRGPGTDPGLTQERLDATDRRLLNIIQSDFPLEGRPYARLASELDISEAEAFDRVRALRASGFIRRLGANFQSSRLGFVSTLCAMSVPPDRLAAVTELLNSCAGVTHNYERAHHYNIWFTLISPSRAEAARILADLEHKSGLSILNLPATHFFKIRVDFPMADE